MGLISMYILESLYQILPKSCCDLVRTEFRLVVWGEIGFFIILRCSICECVSSLSEVFIYVC